jgi:CarD family transcriptional regulator
VDLKPGEVVVHPQHGTATVVDVEKRTVAGVERQYVVLRHVDDDLVLRVPIESLEDLGVRATVSKKQGRKILETLSAPPVNLSRSWQKRRADNLERIRSGDPQQVAAVVRDLWAYGAEHELPAADRRMFDEARTRTINELAQALGRNPDEVVELVDDALGPGAEGAASPGQA